MKFIANICLTSSIIVSNNHDILDGHSISIALRDFFFTIFKRQHEDTVVDNHGLTITRHTGMQKRKKGGGDPLITNFKNSFSKDNKKHKSMTISNF